MLRSLPGARRLTRPVVRRGAAPVALLLTAAALGGCRLSDVVRATDPDVIMPEFIATPSGANAVRIGALGRFNAATTGGETMFLYGGLLGDEFTTGDTFTQRVETDQRALTIENGNLSDAYRQVHRTRVGAIQARDALAAFAPQAPGWQRGEMFFVESYMLTMLAEHFCNGQPISSVKDGKEDFGGPQTNAQIFTTALAKADSGLTAVGAGTGADETRVRNSLQVLRQRILIDQGNWAGAATAATAVPTSFVWFQEHALTSRTPGVWSLVNNQRRYIVSENEGPLGLNFGSANDPRVPTCVSTDASCRAANFVTARPFDSGNAAVPNMRYQLVWTTDAASVALVSGLQARLQEAEARNQTGDFPGALRILNELRAAPPGYGRTIAALPALTDPGTPDARRDLIFREKAFWLFGLGFRYPDMRRMIRQYGMPQERVFPTGTWQINRTPGYGRDVTFPVPQAESNNPLMPLNAQQQPQCADRNA